MKTLAKPAPKETTRQRWTRVIVEIRDKADRLEAYVKGLRDAIAAAECDRVKLPDGDVVRFKPDNRARYFMDFCGWEGLPSDREFRDLGELAEDSSGWHKLVAPGYGARGNYGNGAIFISPAQLARWRIP